MKPRIFAVTILAVIILAASCWFYVSATCYEVVSQKAYQTGGPTEKGTRGYPVGSHEKLSAALSKYAIAESDFQREQGPVNFNSGFVFVVENGTLIKISRGNSGFDLALVKPATNVSFAVVRGPRSRSLKVVDQQ